MLFAVTGATLTPASAKPARKQATLVIDANTGKILHAQDADALRYPASLTKMMTLYMIFSEIEQGRLKFTSKIRFSRRASKAPPSKLGIKRGKSIEVLDAIKALVTKSANDVARAVAEKIGRTEYGFAKKMTKKAREIGMTSTTFANASGLPNKRQRSTARDMVTLALRLQDEFPQYYHFFAMTEFNYRGKRYKNHNNLLKRFPGMDGIKTGYTRASGFNLVSSVRAGKKHVVAAVFGGRTAKARDAHMQVLLFKALERASEVKTRKPLLTRQAIAGRRPPRQRQTPKLIHVPQQIQTKPRQLRKVAKPQRPARPQQQARVQDQLTAAITNNARRPPPQAAPRLDLGALRAEMTDPTAPTPQPSAPSQPGGIADIIAQMNKQQSWTASTKPPQNTPAPRFAANQHGSWEVQVGAFASHPEAKARLSLARSTRPNLLARYGELITTVNQNGKTIYRSRFVGFSEQAAIGTCRELIQKKIECIKVPANRAHHQQRTAQQ